VHSAEIDVFSIFYNAFVTPKIDVAGLTFRCNNYFLIISIISSTDLYYLTWRKY
jgi:hypothetical protein